jgi:hypothetical protein
MGRPRCNIAPGIAPPTSLSQREDETAEKLVTVITFWRKEAYE